MRRSVLKRLTFPLALVMATPAQAAEYRDAPASVRLGADPPAVIAECISAAARVHHLPATALGILLIIEGGAPGRVSRNDNGTVDIGPMQVNDTWVPKIAGHWGASHDAAYRALRDNFCANVEGGAWILRQALDEAHGNLWKGVALYHSHDPVHKFEYMRLVYAQAMRLKRESARELASADSNGGSRLTWRGLPAIRARSAATIIPASA